MIYIVDKDASKLSAVSKSQHFFNGHVLKTRLLAM